MNNQEVILNTLRQVQEAMSSEGYSTEFDKLYNQVCDAIKLADDSELISIRAEFVCEFTTFYSWVNHASIWLRGIDKERLLCIDKVGNQCYIGAQFIHARDNNLFPVKVYQLIQNTDKP